MTTLTLRQSPDHTVHVGDSLLHEGQEVTVTEVEPQPGVMLIGWFAQGTQAAEVIPELVVVKVEPRVEAT